MPWSLRICGHQPRPHAWLLRGSGWRGWLCPKSLVPSPGWLWTGLMPWQLLSRQRWLSYLVRRAQELCTPAPGAALTNHADGEAWIRRAWDTNSGAQSEGGQCYEGQSGREGCREGTGTAETLRCQFRKPGEVQNQEARAGQPRSRRCPRRPCPLQEALVSPRAPRSAEPCLQVDPGGSERAEAVRLWEGRGRWP